MAFIIYNLLNKFQFFLLLLLSLPLFTTSLKFNFSSFPPSVATNITMEGDASPDGTLRLTTSAYDQYLNGSAGRATYTKSFLLRQPSTGKLADFTSTFTFSIVNNRNPSYGDGLAFFLAPQGTKLDRVLGQGSSLGLPVNSSLANYTMSRTTYPFVAVEFDIFNDSDKRTIDWGLNGTHVGIDINSVKSNVTVAWDGGVAIPKDNNATVSYNSTLKKISVEFTTMQAGGQVIRNIDIDVDLLQYLPDRVIVGFSASTGVYFALHKLISWSFDSTQLEEDEINVTLTKSTGNGNIGVILGLVVGGVFTLVGVLGLIWFLLIRRKKGSNGESSDNDDDDTRVLHDCDLEDFEKGTGPRKFTYNELALATNNFAKEEKLGEGGFGGVYKGFIKDMNSYVAVKKISRGSKQGLKEYAAEVSIISRLRHRNLVQLIGWCHDKKLLLVYEFMPKGSLDSHLFHETSLLTWDARYKIAHGLASGLLYLHQEWEQCVLHRDVKSSNVMLDENFNAKLGDFGLAKLVDHGKLSQTTIVAGTLGYMAMELVTTGKPSKETDVYSFGAVALEIACGRNAYDTSYEGKQVYLVEWVWELYGEGKIIDGVDPKLCAEFDEKEIECLMIVGLWCAHPDHNSRPLIQQAIQVLNFEVALPNLPLDMPMAFAPRLPTSVLYRGDTTSGQSESLETGSAINPSQFFSSSSISNSSLVVELASTW